MTGGTAVVLGHVGDNFAAGMTGGMAVRPAADQRLGAGAGLVLAGGAEGDAGTADAAVEEVRA